MVLKGGSGEEPTSKLTYVVGRIPFLRFSISRGYSLGSQPGAGVTIPLTPHSTLSSWSAASLLLPLLENDLLL